VGGGLSTEPHLGQNLGVFVRPEEALRVLETITAIYRDHGYRRNRKHARLKYLVADWGAEKFRAKLEEELGYKLRDAEPEEREWPGYEDRLGVHPQPQEGLSYVGVTVVAGRITSDQLDEVANLAEEFGSGEVRFTIMQNFYLINIPNDKVETVLARLRAVGLEVESSAVTRGVVACTGIEFCNLAVTETKERAKTIVSLLDQKVSWKESEFFRINVNGCPNSCGQHWIADVGLQGCTKKVDGQLVEHYDVFLGGTLGSKAGFNRRIKRMTADEVPNAMQRVIEHYQAKREGTETFADFCARHSDEELEAML
jgi:sulfite reductase beta subunit-like hemoprotein